MDYRKAYEDWLSSPYIDEKTKEELRSIANDENEIKERFYTELSFGTAGLRGIIGAGINRMNMYTVRKATQGLANYILKAGGKDKGISYDAIGPEINEHVKALILCGATAGVIRAAVEKAANFTDLPITEVDSYQSAVALARETARPGDVVLLSPASTSFDRFANFMERGRVFKDLVNALK